MAILRRPAIVATLATPLTFTAVAVARLQETPALLTAETDTTGERAAARRPARLLAHMGRVLP
jgi:hypothetical protein